MRTRSSLTIELAPIGGRARQLFILLHGSGGTPGDMVVAAELLRRAFPDAALLLAEGYEPFSGGSAWGREWYAEPRGDHDDVAFCARFRAAVLRTVAMVRAAQDQFGVLPPDTALVGFSQGAELALEAVVAQDGLAGRVIAFAGRFNALPTRLPQMTTMHFLHGQADDVVPLADAESALMHCERLHADATLDVAKDLGHQLHPALVMQAIHRLQTCIPLRTWQRAMGHEPGAAVS